MKSYKSIKPKVLIIGSDGLIGKKLYEYFEEKIYPVFGTTRRTKYKKIFLDLNKKESYQNLFDMKYEFVFICAGISKISYCENQPEETKIVNVYNTVFLIDELSKRGSHIIYISSSRVFDGNTFMPSIQNNFNPLTEYGRQKAECESLIKSSSDSLTIVRLTEVIGNEYAIFDKWIKELRNNKYIYPFDNFYISPISLDFTIHNLSKLIENRSQRVIHLSALSDISYASSIFYIAEKLNLNKSKIMPRSLNNENNILLKKQASLDSSFNNNSFDLPPKPEDALDFYCKNKKNFKKII